MTRSQQTEYHGTEDMDGLYYCPICQQTTTVIKDGKCPKCGATMDELSTREQTEDAISRQAAIFLTDELKHDLPDDERLSDMVMARNEGILEYQTQISLLPSVNPQPKTGHWIPVSKKLPDNNDDVLVYDYSDIFVAWYSGIDGNWCSADNRFDEYTPIIAWQPLPKPFEPQESEA